MSVYGQQEDYVRRHALVDRWSLASDSTNASECEACDGDEHSTNLTRATRAAAPIGDVAVTRTLASKTPTRARGEPHASDAGFTFRRSEQDEVLRLDGQLLLINAVLDAENAAQVLPVDGDSEASKQRQL